MSSIGRDGRAAVTALVVLFVMSAVVATPAAAATYSENQEPELVTSVQGSNVLTPGETTTLQVGVQNRGTAVTNSQGETSKLADAFRTAGVTPGAAMATTASVESGSAPVTLRTGEQPVGTISPDGTRQASLELEVAEDASPGTYRLPVTLDFQYVRAVSVDDDDTYVTRRDQTTRTYVTVRIEPAVRLGVESLDGESLNAKEDGRVVATVRNEGSETASDAELVLGESDQLTPRTNGLSLGTLEPGETGTASFRVGVADTGSTDTYTVPFRLRYEDSNGVVRESQVRTGEVTIRDAPSFDLSATTTDLYVDSTGAVALSVTNTGDRPVPNARAVLRPSEPFSPLSTDASLGTLDPGETATARFKLEVADRAIPQEYPLAFTVVYDDTYQDPVESDPLTIPVEVGPEMTFETSGSPTVAAGSTETVEVTVTNTGDGTMHDAVARINANTPFETDDDTAYIGELAPGESRTVTFTVSVDDAATSKAYSLDTTIKYDNSFDRTVVTNVEPTAVEVTDRQGGLLASILRFLGL
ncbi:COG1361 S-layer family protein [Haloplanus salinarum]|uniref:COG1361 S-layer family protein n=1 Tax=Haloplanus salinarum TaxID=1912324 RepID=UPI00214D0993|nr:CARDB domain-containing protein [Haloplanus salinarum]